MASLSVLIITKNKQEDIIKCIESVKSIADEIIVYDGNSSDKTISIASACGAIVYEDSDWQGFGIQRQKAQKIATMDFCLWIDSDEIITPELANEIKFFVNENHPTKILSISRKNFVLKRFIRHCGFFPDRVWRLYPRAHTHYNSDLVHEKIILKNDSILINSKNSLLHDTYKTLDEMHSKLQNYSEEWAKNRFNKTQKGCLFITPFIKAYFSFFKHFFIQKGFLEGKIGLIICLSIAKYTQRKYFILREIYKKNQLNN